MGNYVTALINFPGFYNPDSEGKRVKIEEDKFETTATEISLKFGGGCWHQGRPEFGGIRVSDIWIRK